MTGEAAWIDREGEGRCFSLEDETDSSECTECQGCPPSWGGVGCALLCMSIAAVAQCLHRV